MKRKKPHYSEKREYLVETKTTKIRAVDKSIDPNEDISEQPSLVLPINLSDDNLSKDSRN